MGTNADSSLTHTPAGASFVRGGPFYRAQRALGLIHPNHWNLGRRIAVLIVITWLPLLVLTAFLNFQGWNSLLRDYRVRARLLIAVPYPPSPPSASAGPRIHGWRDCYPGAFARLIPSGACGSGASDYSHCRHIQRPGGPHAMACARIRG
jgi:hypothetical protein